MIWEKYDKNYLKNTHFWIHGCINVILIFLVFSSVGGFPVWKILVIFHGQDVFKCLFHFIEDRKFDKEKWPINDILLFSFYTISYLVIVFYNHKHYFHDEFTFYLNIFEINLAAILNRLGG